MKRSTQQLRAHTLDARALAKASGGRGTYCGNTLHCNACGCSDLTTTWTTCGNTCPSCGCPTTMGAVAYNGGTDRSSTK